MVDLQIIDNYIDKLKKRGITTVVFDMDLTIIPFHAQGSTSKKDVDENITIAEMFDSSHFGFVKKLFENLLSENFNVSVATMTDDCYSKSPGSQSHLNGFRLVKYVLNYILNNEERVNKIKIIPLMTQAYMLPECPLKERIVNIMRECGEKSYEYKSSDFDGTQVEELFQIHDDHTAKMATLTAQKEKDYEIYRTGVILKEKSTLKQIHMRMLEMVLKVLPHEMILLDDGVDNIERVKNAGYNTHLISPVSAVNIENGIEFSNTKIHNLTNDPKNINYDDKKIINTCIITDDLQNVDFVKCLMQTLPHPKCALILTETMGDRYDNGILYRNKKAVE